MPRRAGAGLCLLSIVSASGIAAWSGETPRFQDRSTALPVEHLYSGGWEHFVGGGVAVLDCNHDGYPDLYAAGGEHKARLFVNRTGSASGSLDFATTDTADVELTGVTGAYPLDFDGDIHLDLFVMRAGPNVVLRGTGDCRFEAATEAWGVDPGEAWTTAFSATWEPGQAWPTLAVGNYVDRNRPDGPFEACDGHQILRPASDGYAQAEQITPGHCTLSMLFFDWNGDGDSDLWISNDRHYYVRDGQEQLFQITPTLREYGPDDGWARHKLWGMGIATRDLTGDGLPEVAVTSMADQYLFALDGTATGPTYRQSAYERGTTAHIPYMGEEGRPSTGWHAQFGDVNNDGLDDLFIAKGNVEQMPGSAMSDPDNLLIQNADGRFVEAGGMAGVGSMEKGRGAALIDLNRDGRLDLVVVQRGASMKLYQNVTEPSGHWLKLRLAQPHGNVHGVGARIELRAGERAQYREVLVGGGHAGGQADFLHFGLGGSASASIRVRWPDGATSDWADISADRHLIVRRGPGGAATLTEE